MWTADTEPERSQAGRHKNNQQRRDVGSEETQHKQMRGFKGGGEGWWWWWWYWLWKSFNYFCYTEKSDFWFSPLPEEVMWNTNGKINDKKKSGKSSASNCTKRNVKGNFYGLHVEAICWPTTAAGWLYAALWSCHICLVSDAGQPAAWRSSYGDTDHLRQTETWKRCWFYFLQSRVFISASDRRFCPKHKLQE